MDNNQLIIIAIAVVGIVAITIVKRLGQINTDKAKELIARGAILVDVRTSGEYSSGHIKGARNVPLNKISNISKKVPTDKDVIVYCQSGTRSASAAKQLKAMGYANVYNLGSIGKWKD